MLASLDVGFGHMGVVLWHKQKIVTVRRFEFPKTKNKRIRSSSDRIDRASRWTRTVYDFLWNRDVQGVIGELPTGGSKSMNAAVEMNCGTALCGAVCTLMEMPCEWCSPNDVKMTMCGKKKATKEEVINAILEWMGDVIEVERNAKSTYYHVITSTGETISFPKTKFDDVADAIAVYKVMETSNMVRMFG